MSFIVIWAPPYDGCYEHYGPFDTEGEAQHFINTKDCGPKKDMDVVEVTSPEGFKDRPTKKKSKGVSVGTG